MSPYRRIVRAARGSRVTYALLAFLLVISVVQVALASTPPTGNVTVPGTGGQTATDSWTGSIPPGTDPASNCAPIADGPLVDQHITTVDVPAGVYDHVNATFTFKITWADASNDEILTVIGPTGNVIGSSDGGDPSETVTDQNLPAGAYRVVACGFISGPAPQDYAGSLTITTTGITPIGPPGSAQGITFDHAVLNDPIRMVGEPDIVIDNHDGIYVSGPGGSTTQGSWFWKSTDRGVQWHLVGCPGKSNCQNGGGDTEIVVGNNRDVFASDLQTLQCNSTFRSFDEGATFVPGEGCFPETDRQWMGIYDPNGGATGRRIYLAANGTAQGCYLLVSTDNGVTYQPPDPANPTAVITLEGDGCIGRMAVDPANGDIFVPLGGGTTAVSTDGGVTFQKRGSNGAQGNFFAPIVMDTDGNLWQAWTEDSATYLSYSKDRAVTWSPKRQVSTGPASPVGTNPDIHQVLFPWMTVGDPGRVAVVFYGTDDSGKTGAFPGSPKALWHAYATFSTNAMDANPTFTQVQADEHPMHRGAICTGGFPGCLIANSDRSMADFFMVDKDTDGRVYIAYNENSDLSRVAVDPNTQQEEYIGKPINAVIRLRTGPSLFAAKGTLLPDPKPADVAIDSGTVSGGSLSVAGTHGLPPGNWAGDPAGDAPFPVVPVSSANHPALDILQVSAGDDGTNLTFNLDMADLSMPALGDAAATGGKPAWLVTWWQTRGGIGPTGTMAEPFHSHWYMKWRGANVFEYGRVSSVDLPALGAPTPKYLTYVPTESATGAVNGNSITMSVPLADLGGLAAGDKIDHVAAFTLAEHADATLNDWVDQAKTFSYVVGTPAAGQHQPDGYVEVSLDPNFGSATRATLDPAKRTWSATIPSAPATGTVFARQVLSKDLYTPLWDDVRAGPVASFAFGSATRADLSITKTDAPDPVGSGTQLTYTLTVSNAGPDAADNVLITDTLPSSVTFVENSASQGPGCSESGGTVTCDLGGIANGGSASATIKVNPQGTVQITNTASVASGTTDPNPGDNIASATTDVSAPVRADLSISKSDSADPATRGKDFTYTIMVANNGPDTATSVTVSDDLPSGLAFRSADASQGACSETGGGITCSLGDLANGGQASLTIHVRPGSQGRVDNTASVSSGVQDPDGSNNSDTERTSVHQPTCPGSLKGLPGNHVIGTSGRDVLKGTKGRDVICGLGGNDVLKGFGGDDILVGGGGKDVLVGGPGDDRLRGNTGSDTIRGGAGNDRIAGWRGNDREWGGSGNDRLNSGPGRDHLVGGAGADTLISGQDDDVLRAKDGVQGNDSLNGQAGRDRCSADPGDTVQNC